MPSLESIIERIQKLLARAESSNEHEAYAAASKARELLEKYNLQEHQVLGRRSSSHDVVIIDIDYFTRDIRSWEVRLLAAVSYPFYCATLFNKDYMNLVGTVIDTRVARDVYIRVRSQLISVSYKRMAEYGDAVREMARDLFGREKVDLRKAKGEFRSHQFRIAWLEGTIDGITYQIALEKNKTGVNSFDSYQLAVNRMQQINIFLDSQGVPKVDLRDTSANDIGKAWGRRDGRSTSLHRADIDRKDHTLMLGDGE